MYMHALWKTNAALLKIFISILGSEFSFMKSEFEVATFLKLKMKTKSIPYNDDKLMTWTSKLKIVRGVPGKQIYTDLRTNWCTLPNTVTVDL